TRVRLIAARERIVVVEAQILHVSEDVTLPVLGAGLAHMRAEAPVSHCSLAQGPPVDGEPADQKEATAMQDVPLHRGQPRGDRRQWEIFSTDLQDLQPSR